MIFLLLISHAFSINHKTNFFKRIFLNSKIKEIKIEIIILKTRIKLHKIKNKNNIHISKKKE
jgi:hypothetical protein